MHKSQNHCWYSGASTLLLVFCVDLLFSVFTAAGKSYEPISFVLGKADDWNLREFAPISPVLAHTFEFRHHTFLHAQLIFPPLARGSNVEATRR